MNQRNLFFPFSFTAITCQGLEGDLIGVPNSDSRPVDGGVSLEIFQLSEDLLFVGTGIQEKISEGGLHVKSPGRFKGDGTA